MELVMPIETIIESKNKFYMECDCLGEGIIVEKDEDLGFYDISFFNKGFQFKDQMPWSYRWRLIWKIIKTGVPYADMVTINSEKAKLLGEFLIK